MIGRLGQKVHRDHLMPGDDLGASGALLGMRREGDRCYQPNTAMHGQVYLMEVSLGTTGNKDKRLRLCLIYMMAQETGEII